MSALVIDGLTVSFDRETGPVRIVDGVSLSIERGESLGIVGESGSGKTMIGLTTLRLTPPAARVSAHRLEVDGIDVAALCPTGLQRLRGGRAAMIFQNPMSAFNPVRTIGAQLVESLLRHQQLPAGAARERAAGALRDVGIPSPQARLENYPHQMSGGMLQRCMIALALLNSPALVIADEPTTALDATIQAQVLELLRERLGGAGLMLITHNLGVAATACQRIAVVYAGRIAETGPATALLATPRHPYTRALLAAAPRRDGGRQRLVPIAGQPPGPDDLVEGCRFANRCPRVTARCAEQPPLVVSGGRAVACWHPEDAA